MSVAEDDTPAIGSATPALMVGYYGGGVYNTRPQRAAITHGSSRSVYSINWSVYSGCSFQSTMFFVKPSCCLASAMASAASTSLFCFLKACTKISVNEMAIIKPKECIGGEGQRDVVVKWWRSGDGSAVRVHACRWGRASWWKRSFGESRFVSVQEGEASRYEDFLLLSFAFLSMKPYCSASLFISNSIVATVNKHRKAAMTEAAASTTKSSTAKVTGPTTSTYAEAQYKS